MYTRTSVIVASLLAVALLPTLAFGSAQADAEPEAAAAVADGEPQYGGTFTYLIWGTADAESADVHVDIWPALQYVSPVLEKLVNGNIDKYGPKGTGEYTFGPQPTVPYKFVEGNVVESWEVTPEKATLHVRPGVFWTGLSVNPGVMERREYTAQDLATILQRILESPRGGGVVSSDFIRTPYCRVDLRARRSYGDHRIQAVLLRMVDQHSAELRADGPRGGRGGTQGLA